VLDMLSARDVPCISPQLHHGWEDRDASCRRSRARTERVTGFSIDEDQRRDLMLIGAYRNRIFSLPPPVKVVPGEVLEAYPTLIDLVERLIASTKTATENASAT